MSDKRDPLCRISGGDVKCFGRGDGILLPAATGLTIDASGNFWISGNQRLCKWKDRVSTTYFQKELTREVLLWESQR